MKATMVAGEGENSSARQWSTLWSEGKAVDISMKAIPESNIFRDEVTTTFPILIQGGLHEYYRYNKVRLRN
jgi:hypothetical protein